MSSAKWKALDGCDGYEVSDGGSVRSYWRREGNRASVDPKRPPVILTPSESASGLLSLVLKDTTGRMRTISVARAVLTAFRRPPLPSEIAAYRDGNPGNCALSNLYYRDRGNSAREAIATGKRATSVKDLLDEDKAEIVEAILSGRLNKSQASKRYGLHRVAINRLLADACHAA